MDFYSQNANERFSRMRMREIFWRIFHVLSPHSQQLLSLEDMRKVVRSSGEHYQGIQSVLLTRIVGSEGRHQDFDRNFLPRREHMRERWASIDQAHSHDIILPPVRLYELAGLYFVRDGNHRVSVARSLGMISIDAEVTKIDSEITLAPPLNRANLKKAVIQYEKKAFEDRTNFPKLITDYSIQYHEPGRYDETLEHIEGHKYFINLDYDSEIDFSEATISWFQNVFSPVIEALRSERTRSNFTKKITDDHYLWLTRHWHELKQQYNCAYPIKDAAIDYLRLLKRKRKNRNR